MSPETTEWMQPIRPLRVNFKLNELAITDTYTIPAKTMTIYVFAVRTVGDQVEYLTIDGTIILAKAPSLMYAETLIDRDWVHLS